MACTAERVIEIARSYIGYHEGNGNSVPWLEDIFRDYPQMDRNAPWCDKFFDGCVVIASDYDYDHAEYVLCGAFDDYTVLSAQYYKNEGRYGQEPQIGAQIFFRDEDGICHTGIVENYDNERVYTIEGNAADEVRPRNYSLGEWRIDGYGYPRYDSASIEGIHSMECILQHVNGYNVDVYFDGHDCHDLTDPDDIAMLDTIYNACYGRSMPRVDGGHLDAPWFSRLMQVVNAPAPSLDLVPNRDGFEPRSK